jgi:hypothetical protein
MQKGTVKWFNPTKGYGFIKPMAAIRTCSSISRRSSALGSQPSTKIRLSNMTLWKIAAKPPRKISRSPNFVTIRASNPDAPPALAGGF